MDSRFLGFLTLITRPEPSVQDLRDIGNLDSQFKAWHNSVKIRMMQAESLQAEALSLGVDLRRFWGPPPPGASQELRAWMVDSVELHKEFGRLLKLEALKAQLPPPDPADSTTAMPAPCIPNAATPAMRRRNVSSQVSS